MHALWSVLTRTSSNCAIQSFEPSDWVFVYHAQPTHQNCNETVTEMITTPGNNGNRKHTFCRNRHVTPASPNDLGRRGRVCPPSCLGNGARDRQQHKPSCLHRTLPASLCPCKGWIALQRGAHLMQAGSEAAVPTPGPSWRQA